MTLPKKPNIGLHSKERVKIGQAKLLAGKTFGAPMMYWRLGDFTAPYCKSRRYDGGIRNVDGICYIDCVTGEVFKYKDVA